MDKKSINPPTMATPRGYTDLVTATQGEMVFISGQVAFNFAPFSKTLRPAIHGGNGGPYI
ncbi:MAG TPA: hypothetical protein VNN62_09720 [Methylomirabilota bacterium]|jgi:enamine deaminase RidA (YjgF/YER057c/UK114 family)|nr:hypothetical protein [Methylomirabilota bacterium]